MKVLLVSHSQKTGGAERCLLEAAVGLKGRGFDIKVLIPSLGPLSEELARNRIDYVATPYPWWVYFKASKPGVLQRARRLLGLVWYSIRMLKIVRESNADVVLTNTLCVPVAAFACKVLSKKHVWYIHEYGEEDHGLSFDLGFMLSSKLISFTSGSILVNSIAVLKKFSRYIPVEKFSVVSYDVPLPEALHRLNKFVSSGRKVNLVLIGQVNSNKGQMDAIMALQILLTRGYDVKLQIIGQVAEKPYFESLQLSIRERGLQDRIEFVSHTKHPFKLVPDSCIGLMCSEWEAFGRVTIEYMKLGIPVIGADAGTTAKLIVHGVNGLLYRLRDPASLAAQVEYLVHDQEAVLRITNNARSFASSNFNSEKFVKELVAKLC